jgi:hypothetical protein
MGQPNRDVLAPKSAQSVSYARLAARNGTDPARWAREASLGEIVGNPCAAKLGVSPVSVPTPDNSACKVCKIGKF